MPTILVAHLFYGSLFGGGSFVMVWLVYSWWLIYSVPQEMLGCLDANVDDKIILAVNGLFTESEGLDSA